MSRPSPVYRTDHVACPLNAGKLRRVTALIQRMRVIAEKESRLQWDLFYRGRYGAFEGSATAGWTRPWVEDHQLSVTHAQMVMAQVAGGLKGFIGNVMNTYTGLVAGCNSASLTPSIRHQLHAINRAQAWMDSNPFELKQKVTRTDPLTQQTTSTEEPVAVSPETRALARNLIRQALRHHRKPRWNRFAPALDQRAVTLAVSRPKDGVDRHFPVWARVSLLPGESPIELPVQLNRQIKGRQRQLKAALAWQASVAPTIRGSEEQPTARYPAAAMARQPRVGHASSRKSVPTKARKARDKHSPAAIHQRALKASARAALHTVLQVPQTLRLLLAEDGQSLQLALFTDCGPLFAYEKAIYEPRTPLLALDLGLRTFLATDQGDLLGRGWMEHLERVDSKLIKMARHRQRIGLKVSCPRYRALVSSMRGFMKTEVNRIFNRLVKTHAPAHLILESLNFQRPNLSRRMNRLISSFGKGLLTEKLKSLEARYGITHDFREAAYTSQECSGCGYVDTRNRVSQALFHCKFCNLKLHADVNASRVSRHQRLVPVPFTGTRTRIQRTLLERTRAFQERYPRPRGGPADPRFTNPYFMGRMNRGEVSGDSETLSPSWRLQVGSA